MPLGTFGGTSTDMPQPHRVHARPMHTLPSPHPSPMRCPHQRPIGCQPGNRGPGWTGRTQPRGHRYAALAAACPSARPAGRPSWWAGADLFSPGRAGCTRLPGTLATPYAWREPHWAHPATPGAVSRETRQDTCGGIIPQIYNNFQHQPAPPPAEILNDGHHIR